jgi:hypothetical protein
MRKHARSRTYVYTHSCTCIPVHIRAHSLTHTLTNTPCTDTTYQEEGEVVYRKETAVRSHEAVPQEIAKIECVRWSNDETTHTGEALADDAQ